MEKTFRKDLGSLEAIFVFLDEHIESLGIDPASAYAITLAVEELFTNMVKYSTASRNEVAISVQRHDGSVVVALVDKDVEPFDVRQASGADLDAAPGDWRPGGLGLHLMKSLVDSVDYRYENRNSIITFTKRLGI